MKITINIDENLPDLEIVINGNSLSAQIETIIATLRMLDSQMTVTKDGESYKVWNNQKGTRRVPFLI